MEPSTRAVLFSNLRTLAFLIYLLPPPLPLFNLHTYCTNLAPRYEVVQRLHRSHIRVRRSRLTLERVHTEAEGRGDTPSQMAERRACPSRSSNRASHWSRAAQLPTLGAAPLRNQVCPCSPKEIPRLIYSQVVAHVCASDPFHERYGDHLTKEQVDALVAPPEESIQLVDEWLASHGIYEDQFTRSSANDWITVKVPVSLAEKMLDTVS